MLAAASAAAASACFCCCCSPLDAGEAKLSQQRLRWVAGSWLMLSPPGSGGEGQAAQGHRLPTCDAGFELVKEAHRSRLVKDLAGSTTKQVCSPQWEQCAWNKEGGVGNCSTKSQMQRNCPLPRYRHNLGPCSETAAATSIKSKLSTLSQDLLISSSIATFPHNTNTKNT